MRQATDGWASWPEGAGGDWLTLDKVQVVTLDTYYLDLHAGQVLGSQCSSRRIPSH